MVCFWRNVILMKLCQIPCQLSIERNFFPLSLICIIVSTIDIYYSAFLNWKKCKISIMLYVLMFTFYEKQSLPSKCLNNIPKEEKLNEKGTIAVKYYDNNQPTMHFCPKVCGSPPHLFWSKHTNFMTSTKSTFLISF